MVVQLFISDCAVEVLRRSFPTITIKSRLSWCCRKILLRVAPVLLPQDVHSILSRRSGLKFQQLPNFDVQPDFKCILLLLKIIIIIMILLLVYGLFTLKRKHLIIYL